MKISINNSGHGRNLLTMSFYPRPQISFLRTKGIKTDKIVAIKYKKTEELSNFLDG